MALYPVRQRRFAGLLIGALLPSPKSRADASPVALNLGTRPRGKSRSPALRRAGPLGHFPMQLLDDGRGTRLKQSWENGMHQGCQARTEEQQRKPQRNGRVSKVVLVHRARVDNEKTLECRPHRQNFLTLSCSVLSWSLSPHLACSDMASPDTLGLGGR